MHTEASLFAEELACALQIIVTFQGAQGKT
jgi:hypothetical protein